MGKVFKLIGRIDTTNVDKIENNIKEEIKDYDGDIVFDAENLEYISSAGLRMILRTKKTNNKTKVINCNREIYEIFEMTGFSEMMDISKAYRNISVDGCEVIGDGFYGIVYRINPETIVKVYKQPNSLDMIIRERELAKKAFVLGIPTAIPYDIVKVGDRYGSVFELINSKSLAKSIEEGYSIESLAKSCVEILKKMHSTLLTHGELPNKKVKIIEMANECRNYLKLETFNSIIDFITNIPETNTMMHGDFHIKNLMKQDDDILLIDMDTLSIGNPIFEFGAMYATYVGFACVNKNNPVDFLGITYEQSIKIWECIFNGYYENKSESEKESLLKQIKIICYLEVLFIRTKFMDDTNKFRKAEIDFCVNYIDEHINNIK